MGKFSFPDGSVGSAFFDHENQIPAASAVFPVTGYGIVNDCPGLVQTGKIQQVIDLASSRGGGEIRFPAGCYCSGSLFFKPGTTLRLDEGAVLLGSSFISDYALLPTRMEGQSLLYFAALVNADKVDGFAITGGGCIDGCGVNSWKSFWLRRKWNPECRNLDEMRPRLVYISNSSHVVLDHIQMQNSAFWTCHLYRCKEAELRNLSIFSPTKPVPAPSTDAIDVDNCSDVWIHHCRMEVNDDAIALKGGKGPQADTLPENGPNERILIEDCNFGFCHSALTCGSECVDNHNIVMRNCTLSGTAKLFYLKMRPDTPQISRDIVVENIHGTCHRVFMADSWTQFRSVPEIHFSHAEKITFSGLELECGQFLAVSPKPEEFSLAGIVFRDCRIAVRENAGTGKCPDGISLESVKITQLPMP